jgi:hypothetical protein
MPPTAPSPAPTGNEPAAQRHEQVQPPPLLTLPFPWAMLELPGVATAGGGDTGDTDPGDDTGDTFGDDATGDGDAKGEGVAEEPEEPEESEELEELEE